jgi:hypothetical protein
MSPGPVGGGQLSKPALVSLVQLSQSFPKAVTVPPFP